MMRGTNRWFMRLVALGLLVPALSCTNDALDDGGSADVVLVVQTIPAIPAVTATEVAPGVCAFTVSSTSVTLQSTPKNSVVVSAPLNEIVMETVTISYNWPSSPPVPDAPPTPTRTLVIGGRIPVGASNTVSFPPILLQDLRTGHEGHTAILTMVFRGHTVEGAPVEARGEGAELSVNSCVPAGP